MTWARQLVVIGERQELVAVTPVPRDGRLGTAPPVAERGVSVHITFLEMRHIEDLVEVRLHRNSGQRCLTPRDWPRMRLGSESETAKEAERAQQNRGDSPTARNGRHGAWGGEVLATEPGSVARFGRCPNGGGTLG